GTWVSPAFGVLAIAVSVAWRAISLMFVVGVIGGGVDADMVHAENKSDEKMTINISMCDLFIEIPLLVGIQPPLYLIYCAWNQINKD
ncbi:MAG: hypothetical protein V3V66_01160, partial [Anaerolineales bacterium]